MTREDIINWIIKYLDRHLQPFLGSMREGNYKRDFFGLFQEAYTRGYFSSYPTLKADVLRGEITAKWHPETVIKEDTDEWALMEDFLSMWDEWRYAVDNYKGNDISPNFGTERFDTEKDATRFLEGLGFQLRDKACDLWETTTGPKKRAVVYRQEGGKDARWLVRQLVEAKGT